MGAAAALIVALLATLFAGTAMAQTADTSMNGNLLRIEGEDRTPVPGVTIIVHLDGELIGEAVSDDAGDWSLPLPGGGTYQVEIDLGTLPGGVALTDPEKQILPEVVVRDGQSKFVRFALGPGIGGGTGTWERAGDLFIFGLKLGAIIALSAIGLSLIFGVTGLVNFAHGEMITMGAAIAFLFNASSAGPGWHLLVAAIPEELPRY